MPGTVAELGPRERITPAATCAERVAALPAVGYRTLTVMTMISLDTAGAHSSNVRLVVVDEHHQPRYLVRAATLEQHLVQTAAAAGIRPEDMPGLHGLCVEAVRTAEQHGR
ncbi:MAG: hypothetical protein NVSMB55_23840 [Mycobacteriales bacterium]